jgi:hypothetical protein
MPIPKDWPEDKSLPNPYSAFPFVVCEMLTPREINSLRQEAKRDARLSQASVCPSSAGEPQVSRKDQLIRIIAQLDGHFAADDASPADADRWRELKRVSSTRCMLARSW